jgi:ubiquitin conjugation factor E4 B
MRVGLPRANPAFGASAVLHMSHDAVERTLASHRLQLRNHQQAVFNLILALLRGGGGPRDKVQAWFLDCLLVNRGADGLRPDAAKVSSRQALANASAVLLKLCEPFVDDESKVGLVDPGFVLSERDHAGAFALSGPDAVPRLGDNAALVAELESGRVPPYDPKNRFIPFCFFTSARMLRYGLRSALDYYEGVSRQLSWRHSTLSAAGRDIRSDPDFAQLFSVHKSLEATALEPEWVSSACRFENYCARVLGGLGDDALRAVPEDMVDDACEVLLKVCGFRPGLLAGIDFRHSFRLMVKLLSPTYASVRQRAYGRVRDFCGGLRK